MPKHYQKIIQIYLIFGDFLNYGCSKNRFFAKLKENKISFNSTYPIFDGESEFFIRITQAYKKMPIFDDYVIIGI